MKVIDHRRALLVAILLSVASLPTPALAHAELTSAAPAEDSAGPAPVPAELRLSFSEPLELAFTRVVVSGPDGQPLELGPLLLDPADDRMLVVPLEVALPIGVITVEWTAVAADGHKSEDSYSFTVAP